MSESDPQHAHLPRYPGQDRPADPGAESMDPGNDDVEVALPSEMAGRIDPTVGDDPAPGGDPSPS
jgi:hypothetical protein